MFHIPIRQQSLSGLPALALEYIAESIPNTNKNSPPSLGGLLATGPSEPVSIKKLFFAATHSAASTIEPNS